MPFYSLNSITLEGVFSMGIDGRGAQKMRCANMQGMFRILQSIPSKKAEGFNVSKRWWGYSSDGVQDMLKITVLLQGTR